MRKVSGVGEVYSWEEASRIWPSIQPADFSSRDVLVLLLAAQPNYPMISRVQMINQVYLAIHDILKDYRVAAYFEKSRWGMISEILDSEINDLEWNGIIERTGVRRSFQEKIKLTEDALIIANKEFAKLPEPIQQQLMSRRKGWDQLGAKGIIHFVNKYNQTHT